MAISSVITPPPHPLPLPTIQPAQNQTKPPDANQDDSRNSPPVLPPLPPGQGTRVNIIA